MNGKTVTNKSEGYIGSYAFNSWLYDNGSNSPMPASSQDRTQMTRFSNIIAPSTTPLFAESIWPDTNYSRSGLRGVDWSDNCPGGFAQLNSWSGELNGVSVTQPPNTPHYTATLRVFVARHGHAENLVYADGHAAPRNLPDLYKDTWYNGWAPDAGKDVVDVSMCQ